MIPIILSRRVPAVLLHVHTWRIGFLLILAVVCFLSFKCRPQIIGTAFIPTSLSRFFDVHDLLKNIAGFGCLALAGFLGWPDGWGRESWRRPIRNGVQIVGLAAVVCLMEISQIWIPTRFADPKDVLAGGVGVLIARCLSTGLQSLMQRMHSDHFRRKCPPPN